MNISDLTYKPSALAGNNLRLPITVGPKLKSGTIIVSGFIRAGLLIPDNFKVPYRDSAKGEGYQRPPQQQRVNDLANDLSKKRADLPTAVLLNIRDRRVIEALEYGDDGAGYLDLSEFWKQGRPRTAGAYFYVVDGQHRILALARLIENDILGTANWEDFRIPFVCMLGADEDEEMDQFYTVNSKAKSVRTDLAYELLKHRADNDKDVYQSLIERAREWQVDGQNIAQRLNDGSSVWRQRIRFASDDKGSTTITSTSMVNSLKAPLNDSSYFKRASIDLRVKILDAFWKGVAIALPDAFEDPTDYSLQKGLGVAIMHEVLPDVIEIVRTSGGSVTDANDFASVLGPALERLEGDNGQGEAVKGADFWRASSEGAAGSFSSGAGKRVLAAKVRQLLPDIEIE